MSEATMRQVSRMATDAARPVVDVDLERRVVRSAICTEDVADDGAVVLVRGVSFERYLRNPVVLARHGARDGGAQPSVVGRCLGLQVVDGAILAETQFADTPGALEWAWLYGVNPERQAYMRAWSCKADIVEGAAWGMSDLRAHLGGRFSPELLPADVRRTGTALAVLRSELLEYSCVEVGADRNALTRASEAGNGVAARMLMRAELEDARSEIRSLERGYRDVVQQVQRIEELVRGGDGRAAASPRDTARIVENLRGLREQLRSLAA